MPVLLRWILRLGPLNPIAVRLVQNGSRRTKHLYVRGVYLAALILVMLWLLILTGGSQGYRELAAKGAETFTWIAYLQIGLICVLAPVFMAGAIAQEANPETWNILLTTPLSSLEVVLGNLLGRLFFILALLAASLPLFAITQYFGGVPGRSIFASYLVAACAAVLVGTIAIALSVSRLVGRRAVFTFYVSVVTYLAITWSVDRWLVGARGGGVTWMTAINPFLALHALLNPTSYPRAPEGTHAGPAAWFLERPVATWCWLSGLLSVLLVGASTITVRLGGLTQVAGTGVPIHRRVMRALGRGGGHRAPRTVWSNPIAWREAAARNATAGKILGRWVFIGLGTAFGVGLVVAFHTAAMTPSEFRFALLATVLGEIAITALVAVNVSATAISREREDGTLDLILTTPVTPAVYLMGKLRGLVAFLMPMMMVPVATLTIAGLYVLVDGLGRAGGVTIPTAVQPGLPAVAVPVVMPEAGPVAAVLIVPFMAFVVMVGLAWSLRSRGTLPSVVAAVGVTAVISGIVGLCAWNASSEIQYVGPALAGLSPASLVYALVDPAPAMAETVGSALRTGRGDALAAARVTLAMGAGLGALVYSGVVYGIHANMVRTFDMTVRKLAGVK